MKPHSIDLKMLLLKKAVNAVTPRILSLSRGVQPKTPHSKLVVKIWDRLEEAVKKETETGCFSDKNFLNLLRSTKQALIFLCEGDKYYKRWLGLLFLFLSEEIASARELFSYEEALKMGCRPIGLTEEEYLRHKETLFKFNLSGYLSSLSRLPGSRIPEIRKARENGAFVDFPSEDPTAIVRMFFPDRDRGEFSLFLMERYEKHGEEKGKK